jgi:tellurite resistance protein TerC
MESSIWLWLGFNLFVLLLLAFDLGVLHRRQRVIGVREALLLSAGYVALAAIFAAGVFQFRGAQAGWEFTTGYLIEKSLSLDNIFVFVLIFSHFAVPPQYQHRVLFWGILCALVMRAAMIWLGATLIAEFHWIVFVFGAFLLLTGIKMLLAADAKPDLGRNIVLRTARRHLRVTNDYEGERFFVRRDGMLWVTPLFLVLLLVEFTDLVFAVDSIPAIFAISQDPFIVYTSNVFAILGLRSLYFALAGVIPMFRYLKYGLSLVLVVIGTKMILNGVFGEKVIPTEIALAITAALVGGSILLSLIRRPAPGEAAAHLPAGWVPGTPAAADNPQQPQATEKRNEMSGL